MERFLFNSFYRHDSLAIKEVDGDIVFTETSCFDYDLLEYDIHNAVISRDNFIKGIGEFLKTGSCKVGGMIMDERGEGGDLHICSVVCWPR